MLIKTVWGGRSVGKNFRPPRLGGETGETYKEMTSQIQEVLGNIEEYFPAYKGQGYELGGFVWSQGWNDMINKEFTAEYTKNLANLIRDLRQELKAPKMPAVIGEPGVGGKKANDKIKTFRKAQAAVAELEDLRGNVAFVPTAEYWDVKAHEFLKKYWVHRKWSSEEAKNQFEVMGSQPPYHYLGSAKIHSLVGYGSAQSMIELHKMK